MKKISLFALLSFAFALLKAQPFELGTNVFNAGIGLGGHYSYWGIGYISTPAIGLSYEKGIKEGLGPGIIGIGGYLGYKNITYHYNYLFSNYYVDQKWTYLIIGLRATYHYNFYLDDNLDLYGGLLLSYNNVNYKEDSNDPLYVSSSYKSYVDLSLFVGGTYYFSDKIGVFTELGYGIAYWTIGVSFRL
jgi:hypothetical protein